MGGRWLKGRVGFGFGFGFGERFYRGMYYARLGMMLIVRVYESGRPRCSEAAS